VIADSQQKAIDGLEEMKKKLRSPDALATVAEIEKLMQAAKAELRRRVRAIVARRARSGLASRAGRLPTLLKLRARETRIMRSKGGKGGGGGETAAGQKLDQLEMKEEENRYESGAKRPIRRRPRPRRSARRF